MRKLFIPTMKVKDIYAIDFLSLNEAGYENIILDVDDTIVPWNEHIVTPGLIKKIRYIQEIGFSICLLSNNRNELKIGAMAEDLGVLAIPKGIKPLPHGFRTALKKLGGDISNTIVIGDQILTDILGGNIMGMSTILVNPISQGEYLTTRFIRFIENIVSRRSLKNEIK